MPKFSCYWIRFLMLTFIVLFFLPNRFEAMKSAFSSSMTNVGADSKTQFLSSGGTFLQASVGGTNKIGRSNKVELASDARKVGTIHAKHKEPLKPAAASNSEGNPMENDGYDQFGEEWKGIKAALKSSHNQEEIAKLEGPAGAAQRAKDQLSALKSRYKENKKAVNEHNKKFGPSHHQDVDLADYIEEMMDIFDGAIHAVNSSAAVEEMNLSSKVIKLADNFANGAEFCRQIIVPKILGKKLETKFQNMEKQMEKINKWLHDSVAVNLANHYKIYGAESADDKKMIFEMLVDPKNSPIH